MKQGEFNSRNQKIQFLRAIENGKKTLSEFLPVKWVECKEWESRSGVIEVNGELMLKEKADEMFRKLERERDRTGRIVWIEVRNYP